MKKESSLIIALAILFSVCIISCNQTNNKKEENRNTTDTSSVLVDSVAFKTTIQDKEVHLYTIENQEGMQVQLTNFGARIVSLVVPDKNRKPTDVVLGFNKADDYNNPEEPYFGPIVGPFANRIAKGQFAINDKSYQLTINNGPNTLHGGLQGLHFAVWKVKSYSKDAVTFEYLFKDGQDGFPGNTTFEVTYRLVGTSLELSYKAQSDQETIVNLSNHAYFNLNGSGTILDHQLTLYANQITPVDQTLIPTGELTDVKGSPFDFLQAKTIGKDIEKQNEQLTFGKGYDHNFVLNKTIKNNLNHAATLIGDKSGIQMDIYTDQPAIQFYSGNFMAQKVTLKNGQKDDFRTGLCLEPQNFPDAPNHKNFPSSLLKAGDIYSSKSVYTFTTN